MTDKVLLEASGGINPENLSDYAETGVERISMGIITSHIKPLDFSLGIVMK